MKNKISIVNIGFLIQDINSFLRNKKSMFPEGHFRLATGETSALL